MDTGSAKRIEAVTIDGRASVTAALAQMDDAGTGALAVCGHRGEFIGLLTDGDIRRAVLHGVSFDAPCETIANRNPITVGPPLSRGEALDVMSRYDISHLPVVDESGRLRDFVLRKELGNDQDLRARAQMRLESVIVPPDISINDAMSRMDRAGTGGLIVCSSERSILGLLTDGDVRRAILRGVSLEGPCETIANKNPVTVEGPVGPEDALRVMSSHDINHLPVLDSQGRPTEFLLRRDLIGTSSVDLSAVIVAGGYGKRLMPLTEQMPKPMLPVGDRPLLERTIRQLRKWGIQDVSLTTHYLSDTIRDHFGDGEAFGVRMNYVTEDQPLGTAGGLRLLEKPNGPLLVLNGDVLTGVSFGEMLAYHRRHHAVMTVGVRKHEIKVPFGVIDCEDVRVTRLREKPVLTLLVNAGVYLLEPSVCDHIPEKVRFDMTDLIERLVDRGLTVISFPIIEYWQDVGRPEDYYQAQEDAQHRRI